MKFLGIFFKKMAKYQHPQIFINFLNESPKDVVDRIRDKAMEISELERKNPLYTKITDAVFNSSEALRYINTVHDGIPENFINHVFNHHKNYVQDLSRDYNESHPKDTPLINFPTEVQKNSRDAINALSLAASHGQDDISSKRGYDEDSQDQEKINFLKFINSHNKVVKYNRENEIYDK